MPAPWRDYCGPESSRWAWGIDDGDVAHRAESMLMVEELNEAIAAQDPSAINPSNAGKSPNDN
jgi:hypothetical protein